MMITADSADDSIIQRYQRESKELKQQVEELTTKMSSLEEELNNKDNLIFYYSSKVKELEGKLLVYEHDPIFMQENGTGFDVLYWDTSVNDYRIFATFFVNSLEEDLEEFCQDFVLELKNAYMVE